MTGFHQKKDVSVLYVGSTLLIAAFCLLPQLRTLIRYDQMALLTGFYYFCFVASRINPKEVANLMKYAIPFCLLMFIAKGIDFKYGFLHNFMNLWNLVIPSVLCIGLFRRNRSEELLVVTWGAILMLIVTCITTLTAMGGSANVMRELTTSGTDYNYAMGLRGEGVGGYGIAYAMGAFVVGLFSLIKQMGWRTFWKWFLLALMLFSLYFVTQAQFATLLIITFFGIFTTYIFNARTIYGKLKVCVAAIAIVFFLPVIVQDVIGLYEGTTVGARLSGMYDALWGGGNAAEVSGHRSEYQLDAFKLFLESPVWGNNIIQRPNSYIHLACHSTLLAVACSTGVIGLWSFLKTFQKAFHTEIQYLIAPTMHKCYYPLIVYYFLFALFNPIDAVMEASWVIFVIVPSLFKLYSAHPQNKISG